MGCRPSKQATSKVRAVEYKSDPTCLCSPRKARKNHKCSSSSSVSSRRVSSGSKSSSKKHNQGSSHKQRSGRGPDVDFPAFSTTTAVYRTSASKTSKITLRLSCDGSTLEIEQCDYDLEKVRGETESKPRPWNSAPNLTRLRDSRSRLFRDSYFPIKHSASGWSPSVISTSSGSRGGPIRVPVQINSPDEPNCSAGHSSGHYFSLNLKGNNVYRDKGGGRHVFEAITFSGTTFGKSAPNKTQTSGKFSSGDERRPLLLDLLKESHKLASMDGNINKAVSPVSLEAASKNRLPTNSSLDNMINELECSLELAHKSGLSSPPESVLTHSVELRDEAALVDNLINDPSSLCSANCMAHSSTCESYMSSPSADIEHIPVNIISSLFACRGHVEAGVGHDIYYYPVVPSQDTYFTDNRSVQTLATGNQGKSRLHMSALPTYKQNLITGCKNHLAGTSQCISNKEYMTLKNMNANGDPDSGPGFTGRVWNRMGSSGAGYHNLHDTEYRSSHACWPVATSIDSSSFLCLDRQGCLASSGIPRYMYTDRQKAPHRLFSAQNARPCASDNGHMHELGRLYLEPTFQTQAGMECAHACESRKIDETNHSRGKFKLDKRLVHVSESVDENMNPDTKSKQKRSSLDDPRGALARLPTGAENSFSYVSEGLDNDLDKHPEECSISLTLGKTVRRKDLLSQMTEEETDCRHAGSVFSEFLSASSLRLNQQITQTVQRLRDEEMKEKCFNMPAKSEIHTLNNVMQLQVGKEHRKDVFSHTRKVNNDVRSDKNVYPPSFFHQQITENTHESGLIDHNSWMVQHALDKAESSETGATSPASNEVTEREGSMELKIWDEFDKHEIDRFTEDAGYLVGLLCPNFDGRVSIAHTDAQFSFGFEYPDDEGDTTSSSTSDTSDNEDTPLCYALRARSDRTNNNSAAYLVQDLALPSLNTESRSSYTQRMKETSSCLDMVSNNCVSEMENFAQTKRCLSGQRSLPDCEISRAALKTSLEHRQIQYCISLPGNVPTVINSSKPAPNILKIDAPNAKGVNEHENMGGITIPRDENLAQHVVNNTNSPQNVREVNRVDVCESHTHCMSGHINTDLNSFSGYGPFAVIPGETSKDPRDPGNVLTSQENQAGMKNVQVLIETRNANCENPNKNSGMRYTEQPIDPQGRTPIDGDDTFVSVSHSGYVTDSVDRALESLGSDQNLHTAQRTERSDICKDKMDAIPKFYDKYRSVFADTDLLEPEGAGELVGRNVFDSLNGESRKVEVTNTFGYNRQVSPTTSTSQTSQLKADFTRKPYSCLQLEGQAVASTNRVESPSLHHTNQNNIVSQTLDTEDKPCTQSVGPVMKSPNVEDSVLNSAENEQQPGEMILHQSCCLPDKTMNSSVDNTPTSGQTYGISEPDFIPTGATECPWETTISKNSEGESNSANKTPMKTYNIENIPSSNRKTQKIARGTENIRLKGDSEPKSLVTIVSSCPELRDFTRSISTSLDQPVCPVRTCSTKTSTTHTLDKTSTGSTTTAGFEHFPVFPDNLDMLPRDPSHGQNEESHSMPRNNVLSLVKYFEKVPYSRHLTK